MEYHLTFTYPGCSGQTCSGFTTQQCVDPCFCHGCLSSPVIFNISSDIQYPCQDLVELWAQFSVFDNRCWLSQDSSQEPVAGISCFGIIKLLQGKWSPSEAPRSCFHLIHLLFIWKEELVHHWISITVTESSKPVVVWYLLMTSKIAFRRAFSRVIGSFCSSAVT